MSDGRRVFISYTSEMATDIVGLGNFVEAAERGANAAGFVSSSWTENVGPGQTVTGTIVFADPVAASTMSVDVGFSTVYGILGDASTNGVYVRHVPLASAAAPS